MSKTKLENIAHEIFGQMRDATDEERESVESYVKSISMQTRENFFDLLSTPAECEQGRRCLP